MKTYYVAGTTHNICFYEEIRKNYIIPDYHEIFVRILLGL